MHSLKKENQLVNFYTLNKVNLYTPNQIKSYVRKLYSKLYYLTQVSQVMKTFLSKFAEGSE